MQPLAKEVFELLEAIHKHHFVSILKLHLHTDYRLLAINALQYEEITSLGEKETFDREEQTPEGKLQETETRFRPQEECELSAKEIGSI